VLSSAGGVSGRTAPGFGAAGTVGAGHASILP
jgi:hypothetical protein